MRDKVQFIEGLKEKIPTRSLNIFIFGTGFPKGNDCLESCVGCQEVDCIEPKLRKTIRENIESKLENKTYFPEEFDLDVPAYDEKILCQQDEIDLVIILPDSSGSIFEFSNYMEDKIIAPKLRIFTPTQFHPLENYKEFQGILTNAYLIHLTKYGHVYAYNDEEDLINKILILCESFARITSV